MARRDHVARALRGLRGGGERREGERREGERREREAQAY